MSEFEQPQVGGAGGEPVMAAGVLVEHYEGLPAGEAIALVRRAGLRPALERVEGYEPDVEGLVVSQEPAGGSRLAVDGSVRLFIAAPRRAVVQEPSAYAAADDEQRAEQQLGGALPLEGLELEEWRAGEVGSSDDTIEFHEIAVPEERPTYGQEPVAAGEGAVEVTSWTPVEDEPSGTDWREQAGGPVRRAADGRARRESSLRAGWGWWHSLPGAVRWMVLGVGMIVLLVLVGSALGGARRSGPSRVADGLARLPREKIVSAPAPGGVRALPPSAGPAAESRMRRTAGLPRVMARNRLVEATRARSLVVRAAMSPVPSVTVLSGSAEGAGARTSGADVPAGVASEEHLAREFGLP